MQAKLILTDEPDLIEMPESHMLELTESAVRLLYYWKAWVAGSKDLYSVNIQSHEVFTTTPEEYEDFGHVGTNYVAVYEHGFYYVIQNKYDSNIHAEYEIKIGGSESGNVQHT